MIILIIEGNKILFPIYTDNFIQFTWMVFFLQTTRNFPKNRINNSCLVVIYGCWLYLLVFIVKLIFICVGKSLHILQFIMFKIKTFYATKRKRSENFSCIGWWQNIDNFIKLFSQLTTTLWNNRSQKGTEL